MKSDSNHIPIFMVEDDDVDAEHFVRILTKNQIFYTLYRAMDGMMALENIDAFIKKYSHDIFLIVLDLKIPLLPGGEILDHLHSRYDLTHAYIIIVSTSSDPRDICVKRHPKVKAYISKPHLSKELPVLLSQIGVCPL